VAREENFLDRLELPAIKLDPAFVITYANPATSALLGTNADLRGRSIYDIFPRSPTVSSQFAKRRQGKGDIYDTEIIRPGNERRIPVRVAGTPMLDDEGNCLGTLGIVRSLEHEQATEAIHALISTERDDDALLTKVAQLVHALVPFDGFMVTQYSRSSDHISLWFSYSGAERIVISRRWWPIPAEQKAESSNPLVVPDLETYLLRYHPSLLEDPSVRAFLAQGFHAMLRIPIKQEDRLIASVLLMSKQENCYSEADLELLLSLPVEAAIHMAFYCKARRDYQFRHELFQALARCRCATDLATLLAQRLASHYEWDHVIVGTASKDEQTFRILAESSHTGAPPLVPADFRRPLTEGILGQVYQKGESLNIPSLLDHQPGPLASKWPGTQSELCLPIAWDGKVQWILDVEDDFLDAFSKDQEQDVAAILAEVALLLARISRQCLLESTFDSTSDTVLVTDTQGNSLEANPAAARLLGYRSAAEIVGSFERIFDDAQTARRVFACTNRAATEVDLKRKDGSSVPVIISGSDLAKDLFRKTFVAKDLTTARRLEKLESLRSLFQEIAIQTHAPLALVETWIRRRAHEDAGSDFYTKILAQLKKLEITYDRLAFSVAEGTVFQAWRTQALDLGVELKRAREELPELEQRAIHYDDPGELPRVEADPAQIEFIFATILSYLTRLCGAEENGVQVKIVPTGATLRVQFATRTTLPADAAPEARLLSRARFDLALGESAIRAVAEKNQAVYQIESNVAGTSIDLDFSIHGR
jgi:PAS domain S-box-containing protein